MGRMPGRTWLLVAVAVAALAPALAWRAGTSSDSSSSGDRERHAQRDRPAPCEDPPPPLRLAREPLPDDVLVELPALRGPATGPLPRRAAEWLRRFRAERVWLDAARRVTRGNGIDYWGVVISDAKRCSGAGRPEEYGTPWHACLLALRSREVVFSFCNGPELGTRGASSGAVDGRAIVTGICEPDATRILIRVRRRDDPLTVPVHGGFFGSLLPEEVDPRHVVAPHRCRGPAR